MRSGKDDSLPTGMLIIAACLYVYSHAVCSTLTHSEHRDYLSSVFPLSVNFNKPDNNRIFVTHGRLPPGVRKLLIEKQKEQKTSHQRTQSQTSLATDGPSRPPA